MQYTMLDTIISEARKSEQLLEQALAACEAVQDTTVLAESVSNLRQTITKVLSTTNEIHHHLAYSLAKTILLVKAFEDLIDKQKNIEFRLVLTQVLDITSDRVEKKIKQNDEDIDIVQEVLRVLHDIEGPLDKKDKVTDIVTKVVDRVSKKYQKDSILGVMKMTSMIMQTNNNGEKRKQLLKVVSQL